MNAQGDPGNSPSIHAASCGRKQALENEFRQTSADIAIVMKQSKLADLLTGK